MSSRLRRRLRRAATRPTTKRPRRRWRATSARLRRIPRISTSLIGAGRAALELGDPQAAAGFFARADEVNPRSPLPQAGMGAVPCRNGEPQGGASLFHARPAAWRDARDPRVRSRPRLRSARPAGGRAGGLSRCADRAGCATKHAAALRSASPSAVTGRKRSARSRRSSLRVTSAAARARAFVLALTGDPNGAMVAINAAMPGSSAHRSRRSCSACRRSSPAKRRLPSTSASSRIPTELHAYAFATPTRMVHATVTAQRDHRTARRDRSSFSGNRRRPPAAAAASQPARSLAAESRPRPRRLTAPMLTGGQASHDGDRHAKIWLQLASGSNAAALPRPVSSG